jgi:hypothetical protein
MDYRQLISELTQSLDEDKSTTESSLSLYDRYNIKMMELEIINKDIVEQNQSIKMNNQNNHSNGSHSSNSNNSSNIS